MYSAINERPQLTVLDVGHGNSAVYSEGTSVAVLDAGIGETLVDYLRETGSRHVDLVFISHAHKDHLRGLLRALEELPEVTFGTIYVNPALQQRSDVWSSFATEIKRLERSGSQIVTALTRSFPGTVTLHSASFEILHPPPAEVLVDNKDNRFSAVIRVLVEEQAVALFCADVDSVGWGSVNESGRDVRAKILLYPHHGGDDGAGGSDSFARKVIRAVDPEMVVFSMGREKYRNPRPEIIKAICQVSSTIKIACTQLSEHCSKSRQHNRELLSPSSGASGGMSCAGTMRFNLPLSDGWNDSRHADFVESLILEGESPMCLDGNE